MSPGKCVYCHALQAAEHQFALHHPEFDLRIADRLLLNHKAVRFYLAPELLVVHRRQPFFDIIPIAKIFHGGSVSNLTSWMQTTLNINVRSVR